MNIKELLIDKLTIPFKVSFSHASATRNITDSVLVCAKSNNHIGYGESCPRTYVTDENYQSVMKFFDLHLESVQIAVSDIDTLKVWVDTHTEVIDQNPAAWCAIELALLDLLAYESNCSVEGLLGLPELAGEFQYTAVLGDSSIESYRALLSQYVDMGFTDFKLKLSGKIEHDREKCDLVNSEVHDVRLRLDANNLWQSSDDAITYIQSLNSGCFALEEPLKANDYKGLSRVAEALDVKIILDESFLRIQQFDHITDRPTDWIINIRISKMGGLLRSIAIAEQARKANIQCIVGAQVGETSLLTRVAQLLVSNYRDVILAQEGACGTYLLEHDLFNPVLMFGKGGVVGQEQLEQLSDEGFGLGLNKS